MSNITIALGVIRAWSFNYSRLPLWQPYIHLAARSSDAFAIAQRRTTRHHLPPPKTPD
jgi:hypothetical protein